MSYDYPDGYTPPPPPPFTVRRWLVGKWWGFVIWAALDCRWRRVNGWGLRRLSGPDLPVGSINNTGLDKLLERAARGPRDPNRRV